MRILKSMLLVSVTDDDGSNLNDKSMVNQCSNLYLRWWMNIRELITKLFKRTIMKILVDICLK